MSGISISPEAMENIVAILGLTEKQAKVYIAAMGIGAATLGQLSQKSGIHVLEAAEAINDLEKQGLLKKIPGIVTRFIPLEPFLLAHTLEFDPVTLLNISESIKTQLEDTKSQLSTLFGEVSSKVDKSIDQVTIEITESAAWNEEFLKLKEALRQAYGALKTGLEGFTESREKMILELKELEKSLDNQIHTSVEASNQTLREVNSKLHSTSMIARHELETQVQNLLNSLSSEIRGSLTNMKQILHTAFQDLKTTKQQNKNHFVMFQETTEAKLKEINDKCELLCQNYLNILGNVDEKLKVLDNVINNCTSVFELAQNSHKSLESATEKLSLLYADIDGRRIFSGKTETLQTITAIQSQLGELERTFARQKGELESNLKNAQDKMESEVRGKLRPAVLNIVSALKDDFKNLQEESNSKIKVITKQAHESFENLDRNTITKNEKVMGEGIETTEKTFSQSLKAFNSDLKVSTTNFNRTVEDIVESGAALSAVVDAWRNTQKNAFTQLYQTTIGRLDVASLGLTAIESDIETCQTIEQTAENQFKAVAQQQAEQTKQLKPIAAAKAAVAIKTIEEYTTNILDNLNKTFEEPISALIFKMKTTKANLETIFNASREVETADLAQTYPLVGEAGVILFMRDLVRRTKNELEAVMLVPELQTLTLASKLPTRTRVTFIGNWEKIPETRLRKLLGSGTIRMKQPTAQHPIRLWLFIRDKEEILIAPEPEEINGKSTELVGIVSTSNSLIQLFTEEMSSIKARSKDVTFSH